MSNRQRPLRILCVVNLPWDARLGATRVWMDLAEQWRALGHTVAHFSLTEAFPKPTSRNATVSLRQARFPRRAAHFIRNNGAQYDVIDALLGTLPFSKKQLRFNGLLVGRSVGSYWLYEQFDRRARARWPDIPRGKIAGRIFYASFRKRSMRAAGAAIRHADLLNLPNEDELKSLRQDLRFDKPATVHPYGLTEERRRDLRRAACSAQARLATPKVSFVGMWSVRKGSRDLGEIVRRIRGAIPEVTFRFLGTFTANENVWRDLAVPPGDWCEIIPEYEPSQLPQLLSECTIGIFPSYIEGFGLGLLEQLAAGVPTIAYDTPGPRQILAGARETFLVPAGDATAMAERVTELLRLPLDAYAELQEKGSGLSAHFRWSEIASATIADYCRHLRKMRGPLLFTQPFGWRSPGGGARIMRALLTHAPLPVTIVCTSPQRPAPQNLIPEMHLPLRPNFGRLERSRFAGFAHASAPLFTRRFIPRLDALCRAAPAIHAVAHGGLDFLHAFRAAEKRSIPFFLHLHDDFIYSARDRANRSQASAAIATAWKGAAARFVISEQLGQEYQRRYGETDYIVITDGVENIAPGPRPRGHGKLRIYFTGLFHLEYEPNLRALLASLRELRRDDLAISLTMRCDSLQRSLRDHNDFVRVLPFAEEAQVEEDMRAADLLYLPLPFDPAHAPLVRFSLSTKLVTYLGSGVPILYHGPPKSAVGELLAQHQAAVACHSLEPANLTAVLRQFINNESASVAAHALELTRERFSLPEIRKKFWGAINRALDS